MAYDSRQQADRYAPPPRQRETSSRPPSGPSRGQSIGPPRHPSASYSRPYDAPRGPRDVLRDAPLHPRSHDPPPRRSLSLWSTQNPGRSDGYHHSGSGQPPSQPRSYPPPAYRDYDREYDRDYRGPPRDSRYVCLTTKLILGTGKVQSNEIPTPLFPGSTVANLVTLPIILHIQRPHLRQPVHVMVIPINLHRDQENVLPPVQQDGQVVPVL
jgi:hypothetical protein